ncbi:hypothetical protein [Rudaeicoccus suwonensis]|uniref:hypothetical protein n=1 Tax=Rudaeicoccus suwonensis TaxID=657409 RepID=UPI00119CA66D|nr:hypothetical protein [Rudaeicoccus suwonensis]
MGRAALATAAVTIVGAGAIPRADASPVSAPSGVKHSSAIAATPSSAAALPVENRATAMRFVVNDDLSISRLD